VVTHRRNFGANRFECHPAEAQVDRFKTSPMLPRIGQRGKLQCRRFVVEPQPFDVLNAINRTIGRRIL
jgi:hypothetical protein